MPELKKEREMTILICKKHKTHDSGCLACVIAKTENELKRDLEKRSA